MMNNNSQNQSKPQNPFTTNPTWSNPFAPPQPQPSSSSSSSSSIPQPNPATENWGTHIMGAPAVPSSHPDNKKAALQTGSQSDKQQQQPPQVHYYNNDQPYVQHTPVGKPSNSPMESILHMFDSWSKKAELTAHNVWHNRKSPFSISFII